MYHFRIKRDFRAIFPGLYDPNTLFANETVYMVLFNARK